MTIRVGFLGCAHVHAATYRAELARLHPHAEAVAVHDHDPVRAESFARQHELTATASPEALLAAVDAVIITSEHVHYASYVAAAAAAGLPILCEKPLGHDAAASTAILAADAWLSVAFPVRYAPVVRKVRDLARGGSLGALVAMSGVNHAPYPGGFFGSAQLAGGGALMDHVVHLADTLHYISGCEYRSVYAEAAPLTGQLDVEELAQVVVHTTGGAWASIDPSWSRPAGMTGGNDFLMRLWFEHGHVTIDAFARHGELVTAGGRVDRLPYEPSIDAALLHDWITAIRDGAPPPIPARDGHRATAVALGALASAAAGTVITLTDEGTG